MSRLAGTEESPAGVVDLRLSVTPVMASVTVLVLRDMATPSTTSSASAAVEMLVKPRLLPALAVLLMANAWSLPVVLLTTRR